MEIQMPMNIIVALDPTVIISWEKHVGMQMVVWQVRHVNRLIGNAK
jgi:hypothetical protein